MPARWHFCAGPEGVATLDDPSPPARRTAGRAGHLAQECGNRSLPPRQPSLVARQLTGCLAGLLRPGQNDQNTWAPGKTASWYEDRMAGLGRRFHLTFDKEPDRPEPVVRGRGRRSGAGRRDKSRQVIIYGGAGFASTGSGWSRAKQTRLIDSVPDAETPDPARSVCHSGRLAPKQKGKREGRR